MAFSGALTLTDLNDFLTPSQACTKPVEQPKPSNLPEPGAASTQIHIDSSGSYYEVNASNATTKLERAEITLNDCLACSGCITSAESVLITLQSHTEVLSFLAANPPPGAPDHKLPVLSIAPQSLASLAAALAPSAPLSSVLARVRAFCRDALGIPLVFDTTFARHLALLEHAREFQERREQNQNKADGEDARLPMLASACPGWVCYAEKTHAEMLPFIARTKSPQQVMGTLVKEWIAPKRGLNPDAVYHIAVMPCYDKKLEASRQDFYNDIYGTRDVDCVLTTGELELLMREKRWDLATCTPAPSDFAAAHGIPDALAHPGTSSGSYLHSLIHTLTRAALDAYVVAEKPVRGADYTEYTVTHAASGAAVFAGATCYGFRNLQNVVRRVGRAAGVQTARGAAGRAVRKRAAGKEGERGYDYVEVMACPGGCVNGGGQLRPPEKEAREEEEGAAEGVRSQGYAGKWGDKEWTQRVEEAYWGAGGLPTPPPSPSGAAETARSAEEKADALAARVLVEMCAPGGDVGRWEAQMDEAAEERRRALFRTQYRAVESEVVGLAVKW